MALPIDGVAPSIACLPGGKEIMVHPGLPDFWAWSVLGCMVVIILFALFPTKPKEPRQRSLFLQNLPLIGPLVRFLNASPWPLVIIRIVAVGLFLLVVAAGFWGTPIPGRNLATILTWTLWWT
ncbi:MAG: hypothetical protein HQL53_14460, partial [Magnetococcales bacterium]|nr:hypothetical protein [Magnetococcales bacterium]